LKILEKLGEGAEGGTAEKRKSFEGMVWIEGSRGKTYG